MSHTYFYMSLSKLGFLKNLSYPVGILASIVAALAWMGVREVSGNGLRGESALAERLAYPVG